MPRTPGASRTPYVLGLGELTRDDLGLAGGKAANLGELSAAGFPVPSGFVLTTEAFARFLVANSIDAASARDAVAAAPVPSDVADALGAAFVSLGAAPLAVRSSGVAEDLADASFAGQYDTVLDVRGEEALVDAVRRCWASAFNDRVAAYAPGQDEMASGGMAVLVQRLVQADAAGVAFTANPVTGDRGEAVVSAVKGLGERLVSGQASPDEWQVKGDEAVCVSAPEGAIDAGQALAIAGMARDVERHFGRPQDIEWAIADGELFLLQARPITALPAEAPEPVPVPVEPPHGFWRREASHAPLPHSPLNRSLYFPIRNAATRRAFNEFSLLLETVDWQEIGGWEYVRLVPLGGKERMGPPDWLMPLLIRVLPQIRSRIAGCVQAVRTDKPGRYIRQWYDQWQPELQKELAELLAIDLTTYTDEALDEHIDEIIAFITNAANIHLILHAPITIALAELTFTCRELLGWDDRETLELVTGLSKTSTRPGRQLAELAGMARERPAVRDLLSNIDGDAADHLNETDEEFAGAFAAYQKEFGARALRYEVADPTVAETPALVLAMIRDQVDRDYDPTAQASALAQERAEVVDRARTALAGRPGSDRERFERTLARAEQAYPLREDSEFYTLSSPLAVARYVTLEVGRRLAERGSIAARDDVFFLEADEARQALRDGADRKPLATRRKGERAWVVAHPGPSSYGKDPGPPPSFAALPPEARLAMEAILWYVDRAFAAEESERVQVAGEPLCGIAASAGRYTGPARVIMSEAEFAKLRPGDVLVCPITSPVWSVLFPSVGALVTDTGGILSHSAIIAREYRIPAIVATGNATDLIRDGQRVTVDGTAGVAELAEE